MIEGMHYIKDDYVSFEIAKLLKEKGFNEICYGWYTNITKPVFHFARNPFNDYHFNSCPNIAMAIDHRKEKFSAPTLQFAMKWLREIHNLHIMVNCVGKVNYDPIIQRFDGKDFEVEGVEVGTTRRINGKWENVRRGFKTYEEACEAAIKYCLENLI